MGAVGKGSGWDLSVPPAVVPMAAAPGNMGKVNCEPGELKEWKGLSLHKTSTTVELGICRAQNIDTTPWHSHQKPGCGKSEKKTLKQNSDARLKLSTSTQQNLQTAVDVRLSSISPPA